MVEFIYAELNVMFPVFSYREDITLPVSLDGHVKDLPGCDDIRSIPPEPGQATLRAQPNQ